MIKMTFHQKLEDNYPGKLPTVPCSDPSRRAAAIMETFKRVILLALVSFGLFANVAKAQFIGITKPFDPASQELTPIGEAIVTGNGIEYHGGPVMLGPHNVYFIWYGNFSGNIALTMLPDLIKGFNGSRYFNTNTTYGDATGNIANTVAMAGQTFDSYSQGTALTQATFTNVINRALNSGAFSVDSHGIYFVLTSPDVSLTTGTTSFCGTYCGFHTFGTFGTTDIKVAFVGDPATQCPRGHPGGTCSPQSLSPNGDEGADAMASVMAHELNETVTDPHGDAWFHVDTAHENGDLCNFKFGNATTPLDFSS